MAGKTGSVTVRILGDNSSLKSALDDSEGKLSKLGGGIKKLGLATLGGGAALTAFGVKAVQAFGDAEKVSAQTEAAIKSTGNAAGVTGDHIEKLAGNLSMLSGTDDDVIQSGENMLLTFTNLQNKVGKGNDIFDQATQTMLDMSTALGQDTKSSAMQLGKALNDPVKGLTALSRVGVSFTAQQKDQIKELAGAADKHSKVAESLEKNKTKLEELEDAGKGASKGADLLRFKIKNQEEALVRLNKQMHDGTGVMEAQKIILAELDKEFGGSAKAAGETFAGKVDILKVRLGNLTEEVGGKLVPILLELSDWLSENIPKAIDYLRPKFEAVRDVIVRVAATIGDLVDRFRSGQGAIGDAGDKVGGTFQKIAAIAKPAFDAVRAVIDTTVKIITDLWDRFGDHLLSHLETAFHAMSQLINGVLDVIRGIFNVFAGIFTGDWKRVWEGLTGIFSGAWNALVGAIKTAINGLSAVIGAATAVVSAAFGLVWHSIETAFTDAWAGVKTAISNAWDGIVSFFKNTAPGALKSAASGMWDGLKDAFKASFNWIISKWNALDFTIAGWKLPFPPHTQFPSLTIGVPDIPLLAKGGIVSRPTLAMVGEAGPEAVIPLGRGGGMGTVVNLYVQGNLLGSDEATLARYLNDIIARETRRSG